MANTTTKLLGLALAGAGVFGLWTVGQSLLGDDEAANTRHVVNQVWIERLPDGPRDLIAHMVLLDFPEGRIGAAGKSSKWRHMVEMFQFGLEGQRLSVHFPQDRVKAQLHVRSWNCEGEAPEPFELCLEISNGRRSVVFYSLEEWHIEPKRAAESFDEIRAAHPEMAGMLPAVGATVEVTPEALEAYERDDSAFLRLGDE